MISPLAVSLFQLSHSHLRSGTAYLCLRFPLKNSASGPYSCLLTTVVSTMEAPSWQHLLPEDFGKNLSSLPRALDHSLEKPKQTTWPTPHHCQPFLLLSRRFTDVPNCSIFDFLLGIFPSCYFLRIRKLTRP